MRCKCSGSRWESFKRASASVVVACVSNVILALPIVAAEDPDPKSGWQTTPSLKWSNGDHEIDLGTEVRYRWEHWRQRVDDGTGFSGLRVKLNGGYTWRNQLRLFAEGQLTSLFGLESDATGAAGLYRASTMGTSETVVKLRQLYAEGRLEKMPFLRVGRQDVRMGTVVGYPEANWKFLKVARLSQRLLGPVGWTDVARSYDSVTAKIDPLEGHAVHLFAGQPTTGVFEVENAYEPNRDIAFGGFDWTAKRGTVLKDTELTGFFMAYDDSRDPADVAGLFGDIRLYTMGGSLLGVYPLGPGRADVLLWGALQVGSYHDMTATRGIQDLDQLAGALIGEVGYQLPDVWGAPWLRFGVNFASGDDDPDDDDHNTFYNLLPTNHLYYGYADQLAFSNLIDMLVQFKLSPLPKVGLDLTFHQFWLRQTADGRWFGTGAYSKQSLGFGQTPSNGSHDVGQEIDVTLSYQVHRTLKLTGGYSILFGGKVFEGAQSRDTEFGYLQAQFNY